MRSMTDEGLRSHAATIASPHPAPAEPPSPAGRGLLRPAVLLRSPMSDPSHLATYLVAGTATAGVIFRPFGLREAIFAVAGALVLVLAGLVDLEAAKAAIARGTEVYLFLAGMMVLAELARREKVFDWTAAHAARLAGGSGARLFDLVFLTGVVVTALLSNDATAVVLTPAVYAAARATKADPLPALYACAFVANAASFILPISNPANLVMFGAEIPTLGPWLAWFAAPSAIAVGATWLVLRWRFRRVLAKPIKSRRRVPICRSRAGSPRAASRSPARCC